MSLLCWMHIAFRLCYIGQRATSELLIMNDVFRTRKITTLFIPKIFNWSVYLVSWMIKLRKLCNVDLYWIDRIRNNNEYEVKNVPGVWWRGLVWSWAIGLVVSKSVFRRFTIVVDVSMAKAYTDSTQPKLSSKHWWYNFCHRMTLITNKN